MPDPDYKALCSEILQKLDQYEDGQRVDWDAWRNNARALLAQPEPQGPTDEELMALAVAVFEDPFSTDKDYARAVLARWGRPAIEPVPEVEGADA
jgi:hypothetical protein